MLLCTGVVVIDDQPEVSIDDPSFLFESNEGFQEVTSRRTQKSKQKAALEEAMKKSQEQQAQAAAQAKRLEKEAKVQNVLFYHAVVSFCILINQSINQSKAICIAPPTSSGWRRLTIKTIKYVVVKYVDG